MSTWKTRLANPTGWIISLLITAVIAGAVAIATTHQAQRNQDTAVTAETVERDQNGLAHAPEPAKQITAAEPDTCPPPGQAPQMEPNTWAIPELDALAPVELQDGTTPNLPDAPAGIHYGPSQPVGATQGDTVLAGHVDYAPGALSPEGGELSPWGKLHQAEECMTIWATTTDGEPVAYQVTGLRTEDQENLPTFYTDGEPQLHLITCSGPSIHDAGGDFQFRYAHNLILTAVPVS